jgi:MFS transporter, DHA1 family, tetracycline resistance protein
MSKKDPALVFIFFTILIDVIGFGIVIPIFPDLISQLKHIPINETAKYGGILMTIYAAIQFFCAPVLGGLSDMYGRRPVILFALCGFGLDYFLQAWAPTYEWLIVGRVIAGITGSTFGIAGSYIADISTAETRAKNFGMIGAAFGIGFIIGPMLGALIAHFGGIKAPFVAAGIFTMLNLLLGIFVLPESLKIENRRKFDIKRANPFGSLVQFSNYKGILGLAISLFLLFIGSYAIQGTWTFYTKYKFQWDELTVGISLGIVGLLVGVVQGLFSKKAVQKFGNKNTIIIGLSLYAVGCFLFGVAGSTWQMFIFLIPYCSGGICQAALQAVMSKNVPANAQGELQGGITSLQSLSAIISPLIMLGLFTYFTSKKAPFIFAGAPFMMGTIFFVASIFIAVKAMKKNGVA